MVGVILSSSPLLFFNSDGLPTVVNLRTVGDLSSWMADPSHIYVGRKCYSHPVQSFWANPYKITATCTRDNVVERFEDLLDNDMQMRMNLFSLAGKVLGCWCAPLNCHAYAIVRAFKQITAEDHPTGTIKLTIQDGGDGSLLSCRLCNL